MLPNQPEKLTRDEATQVFMRHYGYIRKVAYELTSSTQLVDDIVQDTFVYFIENYERWEYEENKILPLFKSIARNIAARCRQEWMQNLPDHLRKLEDYIQKRNLSPINMQKAGDKMDQKLQALESCIQKLSSENRELVEMYYFEDAQYSDLVDKTAKSPDAVYMQMSRIRTILHDCIDQVMNVEVNDA